MLTIFNLSKLEVKNNFSHCALFLELAPDGVEAIVDQQFFKKEASFEHSLWVEVFKGEI